MFSILAAATVLAVLLFRDQPPVALGVAAVGLGLAVLVGLMPRVANQWERAVVLRLGRFRGIHGPGLFWIVPFIDRVALWADLRVRTTTFAAEKTLTADTVPVDVDAVLFWHIQSAEQAVLAVEDYRKAVSWAAQTALRDIIGKTHLADMLTGREAIDDDLKRLIDARTHDWGIVVRSVEIRDVTIPPGLEDAMSRQAQAVREKQARVILGDAEVEVSAKFEEAALRYQDNPTAFQLRAMNILYEGMKEKSSLMIVPSSMVDSLSVGGAAGLAALRPPGNGAPSS
ncbi:MAG: slipin family protein [Deltaproteobacteria bacterium]|nr:slipin family protein [Deltaproteobacteria bacterium]